MDGYRMEPETTPKEIQPKTTVIYCVNRTMEKESESVPILRSQLFVLVNL